MTASCLWSQPAAGELRETLLAMKARLEDPEDPINHVDLTPEPIHPRDYEAARAWRGGDEPLAYVDYIDWLSAGAPLTCAFDPPCSRTVLDVMVPLNPRMPARPACAQHALAQVDPERRLAVVAS